MFTTLVESRAVRARSTQGAVVSVMLHGTAVAAVVALTMPGRIEARPEPHAKLLVYVATPIVPQPAVPLPRAPREDMLPPRVAQQLLRVIPMPPVGATTLPPIETQEPGLPDLLIVGDPHKGTNFSGGAEEHGELPMGGIVSENMVDQVPRMIGSTAAPRYPAALRDAGLPGRVVVRFVVDTLGRAELGDVVIVEATHALFAESVRNALERYRFSSGEVEGRKVRAMVQLPFTFSLRP